MTTEMRLGASALARNRHGGGGFHGKRFSRRISLLINLTLSAALYGAGSVQVENFVQLVRWVIRNI